jgi:GNAT superfamily N-acetyltransferase
MYWKLSRKDFEKGQGEANRLAQKTLVESGCTPGLLAFVDEIPAGWIAVEPRTQYPTLARSRILKPLDDVPVWSVTCFFVAKSYRGTGLTLRLLEAAIEHTKAGGGNILEGYPVEPRVDVKYPAPFVYTGLASAYLKVGFKEAGRRSTTRPIMRCSV